MSNSLSTYIDADRPVRSYMLNFYLETPFGGTIANVVGPIEYVLRTDPLILAFWNYLPLVYCFKSIERASFWAQRFRPTIQTGQYIIVELNPNNMNGHLHPAAWDWFYAPVEEHRRL